MNQNSSLFEGPQGGEVVPVLIALGDSMRRRLLQHLSQGPAKVSDLAKPTQITLAAVMQHLAILERARLVQTQKIGRARMCQIDLRGFKTLEDWMRERVAPFGRPAAPRPSVRRDDDLID